MTQFERTNFLKIFLRNNILQLLLSKFKLFQFQIEYL
jgi:hypothetical protein